MVTGKSLFLRTSSGSMQESSWVSLERLSPGKRAFAMTRKYLLTNISFKSDNLADQTVSDMSAADASTLGRRYHLEYFGYRPTFYDIGNTCSLEQAGTTITAQIYVC